MLLHRDIIPMKLDKIIRGSDTKLVLYGYNTPFTYPDNDIVLMLREHGIV